VSQLEAFERVLVKNEFLDSPHGKIECIACHRGDKNASEKQAAHKDLIAYPSEYDQVYCNGCHDDIVTNYAHSLHRNQEGYFKRIESRLGYSIKNDATIMEHYNKECGKCHASCGQCHVIRPVSVNSGFIKHEGHRFVPPNRDDNCVACHGSRVGAEYLGQNEGYVADVHRYKQGGSQCTFCHKGMEMHGSGMEFDYRYLNTDMPRCEDCHENSKLSNLYHQVHVAYDFLPQLSCQVCHSQPYKNCNGCHTGGAGITGSSYIKFKIGKNKFNLEAANRNYDYVTVRHIPIAPDTYASWGITDLPNYNSEPTWKYATPHNIQRWTAQTDTSGTKGDCGAKCHKSKEYYLTTEDLLNYEKEANKEIIMDDKINP
jgi:hypothetical protein